MSFTYSVAALTTPLAQVRLELGDTDSTKALFQDEEIEVKLDERADNVLLTAADLCDVLATRFASEFDFDTDGQSFKRGQRSAFYAQRARLLRNRAGGVTTQATTKVDGYSEGVDYQEGAGGVSPARGRVRAGYTDPDLPV